MKVAYLDCFSGISGDMTLGALVDSGLDFNLLKKDLEGLHLNEYNISEEKVVKNGIAGTKVHVHSMEGHIHRHLKDIKDIIDGSTLPEEVKTKSLEVFTRLAVAEAKVHGTTIDHVHFHEVGAVDAIVDIVGSIIGFWRLGIEKVYASSVHTGKGFVKAAHGLMPVPAPATLELLQGVPVYTRDIETELVTPTGAALLTTLCQEYGEMPELIVQKVGYGAGEKDLSIPNLLRMTVGEVVEGHYLAESLLEESLPEGKALTIEVNLDDMNPEFYDYIMENLFEVGAMDVYIQEVQMKKNRPAHILVVQIAPEDLDKVRKIIFTETTTIGMRVYPVTKYMLPYEILEVETNYGNAHVKIARWGNDVCNISPEYEDCKRLAHANHMPLKRVYQAIKEAAIQILGT